MIFFALALSWVKELTENIIPSSAHLNLSIQTYIEKGKKINQVVVNGIPNITPKSIKLTPRNYELLEHFIISKKDNPACDTDIPGFSYVLVFAVILFAFSTTISWSYYGLQAWNYLFGRGKKQDIIYKIIFLLFTVLGSAITLDAVIKFSDSMILALVFPNMVGLLFLFPKVKEEFDKYKNIPFGFWFGQFRR